MTYSKGKHLLQIVSVLSSEQMTNNKDIFRRVVLRIKKQHVCQALGFGVGFGGNRRGQDRLGWRQSRASHRWMNIRSTYVRTPITQTSKPHPEWASCLVWLEWDLKICILNKLQCSCLENPMDRGAWQATVRGVARVGHDWATKPPPPVSPQVTQTQLIWELYFKDYWDREILWEKRSKGKRSLMAPEHRVRKKRIILFWAFIIH